MAIRTSITTLTLPVDYMWKCSSCGKVNISSQTISTEGKGAYGSVDMSREQATRRMNRRLRILSGETGRYRSYRKLKLDCACKNCKHREVWATESFFELHGHTLLLILIACWLLGAVFFHANTEAYISLLSVGGVIFVGGFLFDRIILANERNKELETMPLSSFPVLVINGKPIANEELFQNDKPDEMRTAILIKGKNADKLIQTAEVIKTTTEDLKTKPEKAVVNNSFKESERPTTAEALFCRNCGKQIPSDSDFCVYCGTKIVH